MRPANFTHTPTQLVAPQCTQICDNKHHNKQNPYQASNTLACAVLLRTAMQRAHWQAHDAAVASVDLIPARAALRVRSDDVGDTGSSQPGSSSSAGSSAPLILTSSRDCNVALWTLDGGLVGVLGEHAWDLDDPGTWQDPRGLHSRPPRCPEQQDDTQVGDWQAGWLAGWLGCQGVHTPCV